MVHKCLLNVHFTIAVEVESLHCVVLLVNLRQRSIAHGAQNAWLLLEVSLGSRCMELAFWKFRDLTQLGGARANEGLVPLLDILGVVSRCIS